MAGDGGVEEIGDARAITGWLCRQPRELYVELQARFIMVRTPVARG